MDLRDCLLHAFVCVPYLLMLVVRFHDNSSSAERSCKVRMVGASSCLLALRLDCLFWRDGHAAHVLQRDSHAQHIFFLPRPWDLERMISFL